MRHPRDPSRVLAQGGSTKKMSRRFRLQRVAGILRLQCPQGIEQQNIIDNDQVRRSGSLTETSAIAAANSPDATSSRAHSPMSGSGPAETKGFTATGPRRRLADRTALARSTGRVSRSSAMDRIVAMHWGQTKANACKRGYQRAPTLRSAPPQDPTVRPAGVHFHNVSCGLGRPHNKFLSLMPTLTELGRMNTLGVDRSSRTGQNIDL